VSLLLGKRNGLSLNFSSHFAVLREMSASIGMVRVFDQMRRDFAANLQIYLEVGCRFPGIVADAKIPVR
jgi:hypothetical protein